MEIDMADVTTTAIRQQTLGGLSGRNPTAHSGIPQTRIVQKPLQSRSLACRTPNLGWEWANDEDLSPEGTPPM